MNYIKHLELFHDYEESLEERLTSNEFRLYLNLFWAWNRTRFKPSFECNWKELMYSCNMTRKETFYQTINSLADRGLIVYEKGLNQVRDARFSIIDIETLVSETDKQEVTKSDKQADKHPYKQADKHPYKQRKHDIKHDKQENTETIENPQTFLKAEKKNNGGDAKIINLATALDESASSAMSNNYALVSKSDKQNEQPEVVLPFQTDSFKQIWGVWCKHALYEGDKVREQAQLMLFQKYSEPIVTEAIHIAISKGYALILPKLLDSVIQNNQSKPKNNNIYGDGIDETQLTTLERIKLWKMRNGGSIF